MLLCKSQIVTSSVLPTSVHGMTHPTAAAYQAKVIEAPRISRNSIGSAFWEQLSTLCRFGVADWFQKLSKCYAIGAPHRSACIIGFGDGSSSTTSQLASTFATCKSLFQTREFLVPPQILLFYWESTINYVDELLAVQGRRRQAQFPTLPSMVPAQRSTVSSSRSTGVTAAVPPGFM